MSDEKHIIHHEEGGLCIQQGRLKAITWMIGVLVSVILVGVTILISLTGCTMAQAQTAEKAALKNSNLIAIRDERYANLTSTLGRMEKTLAQLESKIDKLEERKRQ